MRTQRGGPVRRWRAMAAVVLAAAALGGGAPASAQWMDGSNLLTVCKPAKDSPVFSPGVCSGYLMGVVDLCERQMQDGTLRGPGFCMPESVSIPRLTDVVIQYIESLGRERRSLPAAVLVQEALELEFPCEP